MHICAAPALSPTIKAAAPAEAAPVQPPATDPAPTGATTGETPTATPTTPPSKFLQKLASGHFNPVAELRHRMRLAEEIKDSGLAMPEPAAPHGNGKAYQKFLAAYRAMQGPTPAPVPEPGDPTDPVTEPAVTAEPGTTIAPTTGDVLG